MYLRYWLSFRKLPFSVIKITLDRIISGLVATSFYPESKAIRKEKNPQWRFMASFFKRRAAERMLFLSKQELSVDTEHPFPRFSLKLMKVPGEKKKKRKFCLLSGIFLRRDQYWIDTIPSRYIRFFQTCENKSSGNEHLGKLVNLTIYKDNLMSSRFVSRFTNSSCQILTASRQLKRH